MITPPSQLFASCCLRQGAILASLCSPLMFLALPQDAVVAEQYMKNHAQFLETARFWTETYASTCAQYGG